MWVRMNDGALCILAYVIAYSTENPHLSILIII